MPGLNDRQNSGICNEQVLMLVFESLKWDIHAVCRMGSVGRRLQALAQRLLRGFCLNRAPRTTLSVTEDQCEQIAGGWQALAKLMFFCSGCEPSRYFKLGCPSPGHFVKTARFSKASGQSFLIRGCGEDVLHVSDLCEHPNLEGPSNRKVDLGVYRGIFRSFAMSKTREYLIQRQVGYEDGVRCPFCEMRVWSMTASRMIPMKRAARRLGTKTSKLEYFVCLQGHLFGSCWLVHLPSGGEPDEVNSADDEFMDSDGDEVSDDNDDMEV